jgi:putative membrane protein
MERAKKDLVRRFGQRMVTDHSRANNELSLLAQQKGIGLPTEPDVGHRSVRDRLANVRAVEFDHAYMSEIVKDHANTLGI